MQDRAVWCAQVTASQLKGGAEDIQRTDEQVEEQDKHWNLRQIPENGGQSLVMATAQACWQICQTVRSRL